MTRLEFSATPFCAFCFSSEKNFSSSLRIYDEPNEVVHLTKKFFFSALFYSISAHRDKKFSSSHFILRRICVKFKWKIRPVYSIECGMTFTRRKKFKFACAKENWPVHYLVQASVKLPACEKSGFGVVLVISSGPQKERAFKQIILVKYSFWITEFSKIFQISRVVPNQLYFEQLLHMYMLYTYGNIFCCT